jgi:Domain of unknown function (DUF3472)
MLLIASLRRRRGFVNSGRSVRRAASLVLAIVVPAVTAATNEVGVESIGGKGPPRAARSVHLGWSAPECDVFYLEMTVEKSTPGSYFMGCGWNTGYFGIQELSRDRKVALFSVWDPTRGDNPNAVKTEDRVELLHSGDGVRIKRFGGEGTGGQCMIDFPWEIGQANRLMVRATVEGDKTAYAGYLFSPATRKWNHLVTFRTRTGGLPLRGLYSFVEDFRRDGRSVMDQRRARFGHGWVRTRQGAWTPLRRARFTGSGALWEAKDNIDAGVIADEFYLATGGAIRQSVALRSQLELPALGSASDPEKTKLVIPSPLKSELESLLGEP